MTTLIIHTRNEHPDMQANKLNAKYHLHVQHSTDTTTTQGNCIKDIKSNKGTRVMYLKKCITLTTSTKLQSMGAKAIYQSISFNKNTKTIHEFKPKYLTKCYANPY